MVGGRWTGVGRNHSPPRPPGGSDPSPTSLSVGLLSESCPVLLHHVDDEIRKVTGDRPPTSCPEDVGSPRAGRRGGRGQADGTSMHRKDFDKDLCRLFVKYHPVAQVMIQKWLVGRRHGAHCDPWPAVDSHDLHARMFATVLHRYAAYLY